MTQDPTLPARSQLVQDHLRRAGTGITIHQLDESARTAQQAADALGCPVGAIANSLVLVADTTPVLVMTSGRHRVDMELLAATLGVGAIAMASPAVVRSATGQAIGGVAPVGHPAPLRTVIDQTLAEFDPIWAAAGTPHTVMPLSWTQLLELTHGEVLAVASE